MFFTKNSVPMKKLLLPFLLLAGLPAVAQLALDFESALANLWPVYLSENDTKYFLLDQPTLNDSSRFSLYNLDGTHYKTIQMPPKPDPGAWSFWPENISRTLFDNDPATIEYAVQYTWDSLPGVSIHQSRVIREDGTILLDEPYGALTSVYSTDEGAKIMFTGYWYGNGTPLPYYTRVYSLPGTLITDRQERGSEGLLPASLYPNPNNGTFYIEVNDPGGIPSNIELYSATGNLVGKYRAAGTKTGISAQGLPAGVYYVRTGLRTGKGALKMVVER